MPHYNRTKFTALLSLEDEPDDPNRADLRTIIALMCSYLK